jgi:hypothetical protein
MHDDSGVFPLHQQHKGRHSQAVENRLAGALLSQGFPSAVLLVYVYSADTHERTMELLSCRETADCFSLFVVDVENGIKLGNLQQVMNLLGQVEQLQFSTLV